MGKIEYQNKVLKKAILILSVVVFFSTTILALLILDDGFKVAHDGEYCIFKQDHESYDFILHGRKCDFSWLALGEPAFCFILAHMITQAMVWFLYCGAKLSLEILEY